MSAEARTALARLRQATEELIAGARAADAAGVERAIAARAAAVEQLTRLRRAGAGFAAAEHEELERQADQALTSLLELREGARAALAHLARSAAAVRRYESSPSAGQALDQSA